MAQFKSLQIERVRWGDDSGKLRGTLSIGGKTGDLSLKLTDELADEILQLARTAIIDGIESSSRKYGIEISFQVTTNSTIERKAGQAADRQRLMHSDGYSIAYIIDGAGNFQRRSAVSEICSHSDCTVAYSQEEFRILANWIKESDA